MPRKRHVSSNQQELFPNSFPEIFPSSSPESPRRLFIGLLPNRSVQTAIEAQRCAWRFPSQVLPTRAQRLHLTQQFLGSVDRVRATDLQHALADVAMEKTTLYLDRPELWGVAVVRPQANGSLQSLHDQLAKPLRRVGLQAGTQWAPHVTIARNTRGAVPPATVDPVRWAAQDFALIWSRFEPYAHYEVLARYPAD